MKQQLRVAYFPDSFLEVNGVAMTSNRLVGYVRKQGYPFFVVHAGPHTEARSEGNITFLSLKRSPMSFTMDEGLRYDPFFQRHVNRVRAALEEFRPDVFHITGLNDVSIIGAYLAWKMDVALVGSWHTNLHEYAARRLRKRLGFLPRKTLHDFTDFLERKILDGAKLYYKMPQMILAPNQDLIDMLESGTGRSTRLMIRGVDTEMFSPANRTVNDGIIRIGFVGRLRAEKNVAMLIDLEKRLIEAGKTNFRFLVVGEGSEREHLERDMEFVDLPGFLEGEELARAYANMDIFVFPSETDAYGNVPQEAMASGVPALVTNLGGPRFFVEDGVNGYVCEDLDEFTARTIELMDDPEKLARIKQTSREFALTRSWDSVFETVYKTYADAKEYLDGVKIEQGRSTAAAAAPAQE